MVQIILYLTDCFIFLFNTNFIVVDMNFTCERKGFIHCAPEFCWLLYHPAKYPEKLT